MVYERNCRIEPKCNVKTSSAKNANHYDPTHKCHLIRHRDNDLWKDTGRITDQKRLIVYNPDITYTADTDNISQTLTYQKPNALLHV